MTSSNGNGGSGAGVRNPELDRTRLRAVHAALTDGDIATAGKLAEDALNDGIDHAMVLNLVAGRREAEGRLDEALALLQRALAAAPDAIGIMNAIGLVLYRMDRSAEAVEAYDAALAREPRFAPALANRATAYIGLTRLDEARADFAAAVAIDPGNLIAINGLAALALERGELAEARRLADAVLAREPDFPGAVTTLAGADLAEGRPAAAEAALASLLGDPRPDIWDRALAWGLRGDALDALGRFAEAFAAWTEGNALQRAHNAAWLEGRPGTLALVEGLTAALAGRRVAAAWGHGGRSPAKSHVFLLGFPRAGAAPLEQALAAHPDVTLVAGRECLIDAAREWLGDTDRLGRFCTADDDALEPWREAYWRRVREEGAAPEGRVFVESNAYNSFKLPLIARLFPDARVLVARRDPRDNVLACFRHRFPMADPAWQMLTLDGTARLYAATMALAEASETAFGLFTHPVQLEALRADAEGELKAISDFIGLPRDERLSSLTASLRGLDNEGIGKWRDYEAQLAPAMEVLAPWVARFGAA
jgi:tetratricopeptide (TPR) repeat protein